MKINHQKDYYGLLGVEKTATPSEIRTAYRALARKYHPDVNPGDFSAEEKFKDINEANEVLSNERERANYNSGGEPFPSPSFWQQQPQAQPINSHVEVILTINEREALSDLKRKVKYNRRVYCVACDGKGGKGTEQTTCPDCQGSGVRMYSSQNGVFFVQQQMPCQRCHQRGHLHNQACDACSGFGFIDIPTTKEVVIPKGCIGRQFVVPDSGNWKRREARPGHLVIRIGFQGSPEFEYLQDLSVVATLNINPVEAMLGLEKKVVTLDGTEVTWKVSPGCCEGHLEYFPDLGLPRSESERGNFIIRVKLDMPTEISPKEEEALRRYLSLRRGGPQDSGTEEKTNPNESAPKEKESK